MEPTERNTISINDVIHTLRECDRNARYEGMLEHMLLFASKLTGIAENTLLETMYPDKECSNTNEFFSDFDISSIEDPRLENTSVGKYKDFKSNKPQFAPIITYNNQVRPLIYEDLKIWCNAAGELWDPHKEQYSEVEQLPEALRNAYETLWEGTGDDYLVEYRGQYYYMLDHVYHEKMILKNGEFILEDSYESAVFNAETIANCDTLKDTIILLSKGSSWVGPEHFVSVLINPYESNETLTKIKEVLALHMFQHPDKSMPQTLQTQIDSAFSRTNHIKHSEKESIKSSR